MIDLPAFDAMADVLMPTQIERRKKGRGAATAIAIGTLLILDDGSRCVFAGYDQNGNLLCYPPDD